MVITFFVRVEISQRCNAISHLIQLSERTLHFRYAINGNVSSPVDQIQLSEAANSEYRIVHRKNRNKSYIFMHGSSWKKI
jgi:hypothetical protein